MYGVVDATFVTSNLVVTVYKRRKTTVLYLLLLKTNISKTEPTSYNHHYIIFDEPSRLL